jgi:hypothetical protein
MRLEQGRDWRLQRGGPAAQEVRTKVLYRETGTWEKFVSSANTVIARIRAVKSDPKCDEATRLLNCV